MPKATVITLPAPAGVGDGGDFGAGVEDGTTGGGVVGPVADGTCDGACDGVFDGGARWVGTDGDANSSWKVAHLLNELTNVELPFTQFLVQAESVHAMLYE